MNKFEFYFIRYKINHMEWSALVALLDVSHAFLTVLHVTFEREREREGNLISGLFLEVTETA